MSQRKHLQKLGFSVEEADVIAPLAAALFAKSSEPKALAMALSALAADPDSARNHPQLAEIAQLIMQWRDPSMPQIRIRQEPVPCKIYGEEQIDAETLAQMANACRLPISVRAAQMPDGHVGYGLPIGGVLATENAVIPYAVGVDIGCRVMITITEVPYDRFESLRASLRKALMEETAFGIGARFRGSQIRQHEVLDSPLWKDLPKELRALKENAAVQLGSSGSGNHFVEWGEVTIPDNSPLGVPAGKWIGLLSHSGSRSLGANIAKYYTDRAKAAVRLPEVYKHLAWLDLETEDGQGYWQAMTLAGDFAAANHECIHREVLAAAGVTPTKQIANHHNFAWREKHEGREVIVHRKGATPAGMGVMGVIPGTMADRCYLVRGRGQAESLDSAAHGAGRLMSRMQAKKSITNHDMKERLAEHGVELLSAGTDEAPMAYKSISSVMEAQRELVEILGEFMPRMVRMADDGTRED